MVLPANDQPTPPHESTPAEAGSSFDWSLLIEHGWRYGENVVAAFLVLLVGYIASRMIAGALQRSLNKREKIDAQVKILSVRILRWLTLLITLIAVLGKFGVQTASIVAVLGGLGLAVGLALQGSLSNVASGVMVMVIRPFTIGQVIKTGGEVYIIDDIGLITTRAHLADGPKVTIPNNRLWGSEIVNLSVMHDDLRRLDENLVFPIAMILTARLRLFVRFWIAISVTSLTLSG